MKHSADHVRADQVTEEGSPPPTLDVHSRLTELVDENFGYRSTMPVEKLLTVLETEIPAVVKTLEAVGEAAWSFTELDVEHTISCHADSLPEAYRRACAVIDNIRDLTSADLEQIERAP